MRAARGQGEQEPETDSKLEQNRLEGQRGVSGERLKPHSRIGTTLRPQDPNNPENVGVRVHELDDGSIAQMAGLQIGDIVLAIDGSPVNYQKALSVMRATTGKLTLEVSRHTESGTKQDEQQEKLKVHRI